MDKIEFTEQELLEIIQNYREWEASSAGSNLVRKQTALQAQAILDYRKANAGVFHE